MPQLRGNEPILGLNINSAAVSYSTSWLKILSHSVEFSYASPTRVDFNIFSISSFMTISTSCPSFATSATHMLVSAWLLDRNILIHPMIRMHL
jgi:hypothetical protein